MLLPRLYKKDKNDGIRVWRVWTIREEIFSIHGLQDGMCQTSIKVAEGTNTGKKNERTASEQAEFQAKSMWKKQLDKGYVEDINKVDEMFYAPMLAKDFESRKKKVKYPAHAQPKLDGVRCLTMWHGDRIILLSRKGKEYKIDHLSKELESIIQPNMILDGEIYIHGASFQEVVRLVKKYRPGETEALCYHVYDCINIGYEDYEWQQRLITLTATIPHSEKVILTETIIVNNAEEVYRAQQDWVAKGYEGAIVRELTAPYEINNRSSHLLKVKSFKDDEFLIVDFTDGVGKFVNCVIWICVTKDDKKFKVVPKGTLPQKREWYIEAEGTLGSWLKVKYFDLSEDGIPRFPVGLGIRLPEDM